MKVLVIGQGGREHAIVRALTLSPSVTEVHCLPGNDGIAKNALCHKIDWKNSEAIIHFCLRTEIDFVIIGPEDPLCMGLSDQLRERGILVVGPSSQGARLEGSKIFAKNFMNTAGIPTASFQIVNTVSDCMKACESFTPPYVLKADGLAAGKGVFICQTKENLQKAAEDLFEKKILGPAGASALIEQFTPGWELSFLVLTNGSEFQSLPIAQDHKRLLDQDAGPNTGGMGTIAPLKISDELRANIENQFVIPTLTQLQKQGIVYRGVIFFGLMISNKGPSLLEFNCRFGDPETQVILPLLDEDLGLVMKDLAAGKVKKLKFKNMTATCVVLAAPGYPDQVQKGVAIEGDIDFQTSSSYFIHAGTQKENSRWITNGGRVMGAVGLGSHFNESIKNAYSQASKVRWKNMQMRNDIGAKITSSISG
jgi:phosphoribosylamine---glycine ligase